MSTLTRSVNLLTELPKAEPTHVFKPPAGCALVFGGKQRGRMHGGDANPLNDVCILDLHGNPSRRVWRTAAVSGKVISRRWGHASVVCNQGNSVLMVVGGIAAAAPFGRMDPYLDDSHQTSIPRRENPMNQTAEHLLGQSEALGLL